MTNDSYDPKGLVREAYAMGGLTAAEARSIFLDWALSLPGEDAREGAAALLARYGARHGAPGHPMTAVLREALAAPAAPRRRGGRAGRAPPT